jgi:hypothetical protein
MFRATGRLQFNLLDAEPGFFYAGTYLGAKKILSVGISGDTQGSYHYEGADVFADLPLGPMGVFTAQVDVSHWNGNTFIPGFIRQTALGAEAGFLFTPLFLSPILRVDHLWIDNAANTSRYGGGLAFWPYGHNSNLKAFYTYVKENGASRGANQINVQWQLYFF